MMKGFLLHCLIVYYDIEHWILRLVKPTLKSDALILRTDNIGDFILWLNSAKIIRERTKGEITLLCSPAVASLAKNIPYFDRIITIDEKKFLTNLVYHFKLLKTIRVYTYDLVLNPLYSRDYFVGDIVVRNVCAGVKIGFGCDYFNTKAKLRRFLSDNSKQNGLLKSLLAKSNRFYDRLIDADKESKMELCRNAEFVSKLFGCKFGSALPELCFNVPEFKYEDEYVVAFIGASQSQRKWGGKKFMEVIEKFDCSVVLCGGKEDYEFANDIATSVTAKSKVLNLAGRTTLLELCSVIRSAKLVISNDTVAAHIAAMVRTKCVVICPGNFRTRFHPYQVEDDLENAKQYFPIAIRYEMDCFDCAGLCIHNVDKLKPYPCIENISVDMVMEQINKILKA